MNIFFFKIHLVEVQLILREAQAVYLGQCSTETQQEGQQEVSSLPHTQKLTEK